MNCVNFMLHPAPRPKDWDDFQSKNFICHHCEKIYKGIGTELYYFPEVDFAFHRHQDGTYYRALWIGDRGSIHIGAIDHAEENVLQLYAIVLDGTGNHKLAGALNDLRASSKKFFESMRRQNREIVQGNVSLKPL